MHASLSPRSKNSVFLTGLDNPKIGLELPGKQIMRANAGLAIAEQFNDGVRYSNDLSTNSR